MAILGNLQTCSTSHQHPGEIDSDRALGRRITLWKGHLPVCLRQGGSPWGQEAHICRQKLPDSYVADSVLGQSAPSAAWPILAGHPIVLAGPPRSPAATQPSTATSVYLVL